MNSNKGLLVPINYGAQWTKDSNGCWTYDALFTRFVRVKGSTTYLELIDKICVETGISKDDNTIDVHAWLGFPVKSTMPPFWLLKNIDISTFIELNFNKDAIAPFCVSTSPKVKVVPSPLVAQEQKCVKSVSNHQVVAEEEKGVNVVSNNKVIVQEEKGENVVSNRPMIVQEEKGENLVVAQEKKCENDNHPVSKSVNKPDILPPFDNVACPPIGLDDVKLINPADEFFGVDDAYSINDPEDESYNDAFDNDDPFNYNVDDDLDEYHDPFDCIFDGLFDPYFGLFVNREECAQPKENNDVEKNPTKPSVSPVPLCEDFTGSHLPTSTRGIFSSEVQSTNVNVHVLKDFSVGELVRSKADMLLRLRIISLKANREFRVTHSNRERLIVRCIDSGCSWRIRGSLSKKNGSWIIRTYVKDHTCTIDARFKRRRGIATSGVIAQLVKDDDNVARDIVKKLEMVYGISISYWKAWKAKEIATYLVRGNPEDSFRGLPSYLWLLENANPGTYSSYEIDINNCFLQCFVAFGPSVAGFKTCIRPVIAVDACHLKGRYRGKLFIATCMDGNNQIYPLAFGVAPTENDVSWTWFFQQIRNVIGYRDDLVFISDRHPSIEKCCLEQFPQAVYRICMFHLGLNMNARFKVKANEFLYGVAKSYTEIDFEEKLQHVRVTKSQVYNYLMDANPKKWARCFFPTRRYSIMTTNIAESMNALLKDAREFPIIAMLETIRTKLQGWFHDRLSLANKCSSTLTPYAERKVGKRDDKARHFMVHPIDEFRFYILDGYRNATVDINLHTCTCNKFQLNQLPCSHALRACRERNISAYTLCSRFYTIECLRLSYFLPLNPVPHRSEWYRIVPQSVHAVEVRPPIISNKKGRRRNKRMPSQGEETTGRKCGRCREPGHNRQTCKGKEYVPSQLL